MISVTLSERFAVKESIVIVVLKLFVLPMFPTKLSSILYISHLYNNSADALFRPP